VIDTHCHLTFKDFAGRTAQVLADARAVGVRGAITVATTSADSLRALELAKAHENLWCTAGVHPLYADQPINWDDLRTAASHPKCVAWGELGLDNHYDKPPRSLQNRVLAEQLQFIHAFEASRQRGIEDRHQGTPGGEASRHQGPSMPRSLDALMPRPIIVHSRDSFDDLLAVFRALPSGFDPSRFVFHCFTGTPVDARTVLDFGAWISFTGVVTFANAAEVAEAAKLVPADRIMVETDSPFLSPEPVRKLRPNEPKHVIHIARRLAELRGVNPIDFERQLDANAERFFGIKLPAGAESIT
jgi:TatD DNase family protein